MQDYRKLDVWTKSHEFALDVHRLTMDAASPDASRVAAELRDAAREVPVLIVAGCESESAPAFARAMREAATRADVLAYRLLFARDAAVISAVPYARLEARIKQVRAMLGGLNRTVRLRLGTGGRPGAAPVSETTRAVARAVRGVRDGGSSRR